MNRIIPKAFKHKIRSFSNQNPYSTNLYKSTTNFQGNDLAEKRYFDLRRLKENHDSIVRPNHRRIIIIGAGVAGVAIMNQIPRLTGWAWQHVTMIEDQTFHYHPLGKELLSYNLMDISEIEQPLLQCMHDLTHVLIDTVMKIDPNENYIETYLGEELTYDYLILCNGKIPVLEHIENQGELLVDKFSFVCSNFDIESSKKLSNRMEFFYGGEIVIYCNGREGRDWVCAVNSAFMLRNKYKKNSKIKFVVKDNISGFEDLDEKQARLLEEKDIEIIKGLELVSIKDEENLVFRKYEQTNNIGLTKWKNNNQEKDFSIIKKWEDEYEPIIIKYDFLYVQPGYRDPSILYDHPELHLSNFDYETMQNRSFWNIFAAGDLLHIGSGLEGILEQAFVCVNTVGSSQTIKCLSPIIRC